MRVCAIRTEVSAEQADEHASHGMFSHRSQERLHAIHGISNASPGVRLYRMPNSTILLPSTLIMLSAQSQHQNCLNTSFSLNTDLKKLPFPLQLNTKVYNTTWRVVNIPQS